MFDFEEDLFIRHNNQKFNNQNSFNTSALNPWHKTEQYFNFKQKKYDSQKPFNKRSITTNYIRSSQKGFKLSQYEFGQNQEKHSDALNFLIKRKKSHSTHLNRVNMAKTLSLNSVGLNNISTATIQQQKFKAAQKIYQVRAKTNSMQRTKQNINYLGNSKTISVKREKISDVKYIPSVHQIRRKLLSHLQQKKEQVSLDKLINFQELKNVSNISNNVKTLQIHDKQKNQQKNSIDFNQRRKKIKSLYVGYQKFFSLKQKSSFRPIHGLKRSVFQEQGELINLNNFQIKKFQKKSLKQENQSNLRRESQQN